MFNQLYICKGKQILPIRILMQRKINYLSNKELLSEIHKSKITYCYFIDEDAKNYDIIVRSKEDILPSIDRAKQNKIDRLTRRAKDQMKLDNCSPTKISTFSIDPNSIEKTSLVFRVMTYDHIPLDENRTRKTTKLSDKHVKTNFLPFKHFRIGENDSLIEVGRSHWKDGFHNGSFSVDHGQLTNRLANQFILLVDRYAQKGNWRGYTWIEDMKGQALMQLTEAALKFDESKSENPFAYLTMCCTNCFRGILNAEKRISEIRNKVMVENGYDATFGSQVDNDSNDY